MNSELAQCTLLKFETTELRVGNHQYLLSELISEKVHEELGVRQGVFLGQREGDGLECVIKLRIQ